MQKNNVIEFPLDRRESPPQSQGELIDQIVNYRVEMAETIAEALSLMVFSEIDRFMGVDDGCENLKVFVSDTIKALYLKSAGIEHPISIVADAYYSKESEEDVNDENEEGD